MEDYNFIDSEQNDVVDLAQQHIEVLEDCIEVMEDRFLSFEDKYSIIYNRLFMQYTIANNMIKKNNVNQRVRKG